MKSIDRLKMIIRILIILLIIVIVVYVLMVVMPKKRNSNTESVDNTKFGYTLAKRDTDLYKLIFNNLKDELNKEPINYEKYAEYISELFIVDLYTLNNKTQKNDVGGVQFVKEDARDNYKLNVSNTLYKHLNSEGTNIEVSKIDMDEINEITYEISNKKYNGYEVKLTWEYKEDNEYDKEGTIVLIRDGEELYIVEKK